MQPVFQAESNPSTLVDGRGGRPTVGCAIRLHLDPSASATVAALTDVAALKRTVMALWPNLPESAARAALRLTYRRDSGPDGVIVTARADRPPTRSPRSVADIEVSAAVPPPHGSYRFRCRVTPVVRNPGRGVVRRHSDPARWLADRLAAGGCVPRVDGFIDEGDASGVRRNGDRVTFPTVDAYGELIVTDAELFAGLWLDGVGRGKGYGCGMLVTAVV